MMQAYEIIEHSYDVVNMGARGRDCELIRNGGDMFQSWDTHRFAR
jgi:hypothetical protein